MAKNSKKKLKEFESENSFNEFMIKQIWGEVVDASELNRIITDNASLTVLIEKIKEERTEDNLTEEQISQRCLEIHKNVLDNIPGNFEISLEKHIFIDCANFNEVDDITIKLRVMNTEKPEYICLNANQMLDTAFFLGGDQQKAYLISKDEQGNITCAELLEFQFLSILKEESSNGDVSEHGLLVNYHWLFGKVASTRLVGWNLRILRNFMLGEWFQKLIHNEVNENVKIEGEKNEQQK